MKKNNKFPVDFYINPNFEYKSHSINVLKESLVEWLKPENAKFYPNWKNFKYFYETIDNNGEEIQLLHCFTDWSWVSEHHLFDAIEGLNSFFEK